MLNHHSFSRREMLRTATCGFGSVALAGLTAEASAKESNLVAARAPHHAPRAKRVIFLFMRGGPSHVDSFDPKPELQANHDQVNEEGKLMASPWKFQQYGESGLWVSELFPHLAKKHADDLCVINSMHCDSPAHPAATIQVHTGTTQFVRPSVGSWVLYGLGSANENLPGFVTINPTSNFGGAQNYGSSFLPAAFQGTPLTSSGKSAKMANLANGQMSRETQRRQLDLLRSMNSDLRERWQDDSRIDAVIESYELGFRMQSAMPEVLNIAHETEATKKLYGIGNKATQSFGTQCLLARRMAEAGVRYIEIDSGGWDSHTNLKGGHAGRSLSVDQPIAGLLTDLKQRGLLDDTLVVWGGEFGRKPYVQFATGRGHNNLGYTMWMAGAGTRGGLQFGATDEFGHHAVQDKVHTHDLHATMLHLLGLDHEKLTYRYAGRDFRLTDVHGRVVKELLV